MWIIFQNITICEHPLLVSSAVSFKKVGQQSASCWINHQVLTTIQSELSSHLISNPVLPPSALPFKFSNEEDELGFLFLSQALRFGSQYNTQIQALTRMQDAGHLIEFGLLSSFLTGTPLHHVNYALQFSNDPHGIGRIFGFPTTTSEALSFAHLGGVYKDVKGPLFKFALEICTVLNEIGMLCRSRGVDALGALVRVWCAHDALESFADHVQKDLPITFGTAKKSNCKIDRLALKLNPHVVVCPYGVVDANVVHALRVLDILVVSAELHELIDVKEFVFKPSHTLIQEMFSVAHKAVQLLVETGERKDEAVSQWLLERASLNQSQMRMHLCDTLEY